MLHWLCYGTLWGVIRGGELLEYDRDGDICTVRVSEEKIEKSKPMSHRCYCYTVGLSMFLSISAQAGLCRDIGSAISTSQNSFGTQDTLL